MKSWLAIAGGTIFGLTRGVNRAHIVRAALESIAYQSEDLLSAMRADYGKELEIIKADGGATANGFLMQFQADVSGIPVLLPEVSEITALGAAYLAGLQSGFWTDLNDIVKNWQIRCRFEPDMKDKDRDELLAARAAREPVSEAADTPLTVDSPPADGAAGSGGDPAPVPAPAPKPAAKKKA